MIDSLYIGATGMQTQQLSVDTIANNLANVNTVGFKRSRVSFQDLMYRDVAPAGNATAASGNQLRSGVGVALAGLGKIFTAGELKKTDNAMDVAIRGQGFFEVSLPDGGVAYTRTGSLRVNREGQLATIDGYVLNPDLQVPPDVREIVIADDGTVQAKIGDSLEMVEIGRIGLTSFVNPAGLAPLGENLYRATVGSGEASYGHPGDEGFGALAQGFQETSNVKLVDEMVNLMIAQRAYEVSAKVVQASDELMAMSNNLRR